MVALDERQKCEGGSSRHMNGLDNVPPGLLTRTIKKIIFLGLIFKQKQENTHVGHSHHITI